MEPMAIPRITPPSAEEFAARYVRGSQPVIVRGAIDAWPAMERWSGDYFRRRFGNREVPALQARGGALYDTQSGAHYGTVRVAEYVDALDAQTRSELYMAFRVQDVMPELLDDIVPPPYCGAAPWRSTKLWFAGPDTKSPLHRDLPHNLYAQIIGRKRFLLLDRRRTRMVHRHSFLSRVPNCSPVDAESPDLDRFPRFRDAPLLLADLQRGDLLYIPSLWWHQARSVGTSVSVNLFWAHGPMAALAKAAELFLRVRKIKL
jgi:hypothetical protein